MTTTAELADFVRTVEYDGLGDDVVEELKRHVLDSVGAAVASMGAGPTEAVRSTVVEQNAKGRCRLWGDDWAASPPDAAMYNTALTRHTGLADAFPAPDGPSHPGATVASVVACAEVDGRSGRDLLAALAAAYEVHGELARNVPVRKAGWDCAAHTVVSAACGAGRACRLDREQLRAAVGIAGAHAPLRAVGTGEAAPPGFADANAARNAVYASMLARNGTDGPGDVFEGPGGWTVAGVGEVALSPSVRCERVLDVATRRHAAGVYAQSAVEGVLDVAREHDVRPGTVERIRVSTVRNAVAAGDGGREVREPAEAARSLRYAVAAALLDRELTPAQYDPERVRREDVQSLVRKVDVVDDPGLADRAEAGEVPAAVAVELTDGSVHRVECLRPGARPDDRLTWEQLEAKFHAWSRDRYGDQRRADVVSTVRTLEDRPARDLVELLD